MLLLYDACIIVKGPISVENMAAAGVAANSNNIEVIFKTVLHLLVS